MGLEAWNHYVPIEDIGFSDLPSKLEWCKLHDKECREISCRATEYMRPFFNQGIENTICQGVMDYYEENLTLI
jgi:hypothetical protein